MLAIYLLLPLLSFCFTKESSVSWKNESLTIWRRLMSRHRLKSNFCFSSALWLLERILESRKLEICKSLRCEITECFEKIAGVCLSKFSSQWLFLSYGLTSSRFLRTISRPGVAFMAVGLDYISWKLSLCCSFKFSSVQLDSSSMSSS